MPDARKAKHDEMRAVVADPVEGPGIPASVIDDHDAQRGGENRLK